MSDDLSPFDSWWPEDLPEEDRRRIEEEMEGPYRLNRKDLEKTIKRLEKCWRQICDDLQPHKIYISPLGFADSDPSIWDLSACDPRSANLAWLMFELGSITAEYDHCDNDLRVLARLEHKGAEGTKKLNLKGDETTRRIRTAFAELLENDEDAIRLTEFAIAKRLFQQPEPPAAESTIRRELREFREEIQARAAELKILGRFNESKIRRVAKDGEGKPGVSFRTVSFFLA